MNRFSYISIFCAATFACLRLTIAAQTNSPSGPPGPISYESFRIIPDRNIFNPNRSPRSSGTPVRREVRTNAVVDSVVLTGVMSYAKGDVAFFEGTRSEYRKALREQGEIAGFKVAQIEPKAVTLAKGTNSVRVPVGMQLRRQDEGEWQLAERSDALASSVSYSSSPASSGSAPGTSSSSDSNSSGSEDEVLRKLMQRREQEMNR